MMEDPFCYPPSFEKLTGDLTGLYSRRINRQHRIVYEVDKNKNIIDSITTKFPGAIDDFLKFINMISLHFNQFKNVVAEISKVVMSNTNIFKQQ